MPIHRVLPVQAKISEQKWAGYYLSNGDYAIRYCPKQSETLTFKIASPIAGFSEQSGQFVVDNMWHGKKDQLIINWA